LFEEGGQKAMPAKSISETDVRNNPHVDPKLIEESRRYTESLKQMGVDVKRQYSLEHPFDGGKRTKQVRHAHFAGGR
jgi:hypothetical protein